MVLCRCCTSPCRGRRAHRGAWTHGGWLRWRNRPGRGSRAATAAAAAAAAAVVVAAAGGGGGDAADDAAAAAAPWDHAAARPTRWRPTGGPSPSSGAAPSTTRRRRPGRTVGTAPPRRGSPLPVPAIVLHKHLSRQRWYRSSGCGRHPTFRILNYIQYSIRSTVNTVRIVWYGRSNGYGSGRFRSSPIHYNKAN